MKGQTISTKFYKKADIAQSDFRTKKSLGQNFIFDMGFLNSVVDKLCIAPTDVVVEIGTGKGTLTKCLATRAKHVITYEIDPRLAEYLRAEFAPIPNIELRLGDFMTSGDTAGGIVCESMYRVIANIPYYITTPIIMKLLADPHCTEICVLVQEEVARRIVATHGTPEYGALSVTCQLCAECRILKTVGRALFHPRPNVDSAFVILKKQGENAPKGFEVFIKNIFSKRRKKISNSVDRALLEKCGVDANLRPEQLSPLQFRQIYDTMG